MARKTVGLVGLWDCVAFDEVAGINFKDKDGIQIMKDYMASGSFARGKEEKAANASMVLNIVSVPVPFRGGRTSKLKPTEDDSRLYSCSNMSYL